MAKVVVIDEQDVEYSSTLTKSDIGKFAVVDNGCFFIKGTKEEAEELRRVLLS